MKREIRRAESSGGGDKICSFPIQLKNRVRRSILGKTYLIRDNFQHQDELSRTCALEQKCYLDDGHLCRNFDTDEDFLLTGSLRFVGSVPCRPRLPDTEQCLELVGLEHTITNTALSQREIHPAGIANWL